MMDDGAQHGKWKVGLVEEERLLSPNNEPIGRKLTAFGEGPGIGPETALITVYVSRFDDGKKEGGKYHLGCASGQYFSEFVITHPAAGGSQRQLIALFDRRNSTVKTVNNNEVAFSPGIEVHVQIDEGYVIKEIQFVTPPPADR